MFTFMKKKGKEANCLLAPVSGKIIPLEAVADPVFAQKMMGEGIAIEANEGEVVAPAKGTITLIANTLHAFGMTMEDGTEIMVHIGLETVALQGEGFQALVKIGDQVEAGCPIIRMDMSVMKAKEVSLVTPLIVINHQDHPIQVLQEHTMIQAKEPILTFI